MNKNTHPIDIDDVKFSKNNRKNIFVGYFFLGLSLAFFTVAITSVVIAIIVI